MDDAERFRIEASVKNGWNGAQRGRKRRVMLMHDIMAPYRLALFQRLSQSPGLDLCVYFMRESAANRRWRVDHTHQFKHKVLPGIALNFKGPDLFTYIINPSVPLELLRNQYDAVVAHGWLNFASQAAFLTCKAGGIPYVLWAGSTINEPSWRRTVSLPLVKLMLRGADACISYGTRSKEYLIHLGAAEEKIFIAINTVDIDHFRRGSTLSSAERAALKRELGVEGRKVILYTGQLIERKGLRYLIEAYGLLRGERPDVSLLVVGYGPQEKELKELCAEQGTEDVHFIGHLDVNEIPRYYGISDLYVLPSTEEVWGLVVNEAMACSLPVITTQRVGASADLVEDGVNGFVVREADARQLFEAMKRSVQDAELRRRMADASWERIRRFGLEASVEGFLSAIEYAMTRNR
ncbi:MAG: glycosyltransferase family 4 protein [Anaerolineae bacterium]